MTAFLGISTTGRRAAALLGVAVTIALTIGGCTGGSTSDSAAGNSDAKGVAAAPARPAPARAKQSAAASTPLQQRAIVRTATIKLRTHQVDNAANAIVALADPAGGRVDGDDRSTHGSIRAATLVLRVPPDALNRIITRVDALGTEISRSVHGQDVTASKADIAARTGALQTSVTRLQSFLSHSGSISSLVSLEDQLTKRESELESMQGQQRALADQISLATLTVELSTTPKPVVRKPPPKAAGLGSAFVSGWHALTRTVRWVVRIVGYSLPITAVVALIAAGCILVWRRRRGNAEPAPGSTP